MKKLVTGIFLLGMIIFATACQGEDREAIEGFPYDNIHTNFSYHPFSIPEGWDVVSVQANVEHRQQDWDEPENHRYSEVPYRYTIIFGGAASENEVSEEELEQFNEKQALQGKTIRQLYYHTYYEHYATLKISKNGFIKLLNDFDETEEWEIEGEDVLVLRRGNEWLVNWYKDNTYYDLSILGEADISTEAALEELLKTLFF